MIQVRGSRARADAVLLLVVGVVGGALLGTLLAHRGEQPRNGRRSRPRRPRPGAAPEPDDVPAPLAVLPPADADERLEAQVLDAFRHHPVLARRAIDISAQAGEVTLTGWVRAAAERRAAVALARGIPGIRGVRSEMVVVPITFHG